MSDQISLNKRIRELEKENAQLRAERGDLVYIPIIRNAADLDRHEQQRDAAQARVVSNPDEATKGGAKDP